MATHTHCTTKTHRVGDWWERVKADAAVVAVAVGVITIIAVLAIPAFGTFIALWSGRWPW